ncbi:MAG: hypothetical protein ACK6AO_18305 [Planctomycetota bacterium]
MGIAICLGPGCCVLVLSGTVLVLVLERGLAGAFMRVLWNVNSIPQSNSHHPITSMSTSTNSISFSLDNT